MTLSLTVPLHRGETLASFCSRTAARNGLPSARVFAAHLGFSFNGLSAGKRQDVERFAQAVGRLPESLGPALVQSDGIHVAVAGEKLPRPYLQRHRLRFCPHCVQEDEANGTGRAGTRAYGRMAWLVSLIRTCPIHRTRLLTSARSRPEALDDFFVRLGWELPLMPEHLRKSVRQQPTRLETYVVDRLNGDRTHVPFLDELPMYAAGQLSDWVGAVLMFGVDFKPNEMTEDNWREAGGEGFEALSEGERGFRQFLKSLHPKSSPGGLGSADPSSVYGQLYTSLMFCSGDAAFDRIRAIVREASQEHLPLASRQVGPHSCRTDVGARNRSDGALAGPAEPQQDSCPDDGSGPISVAAAAKLMRSTRPAVMALVKQGLLVNSPARDGAAQPAIDPDDLRRFTSTYVSVGRLSQEFGIGTARLRAALTALGVKPAFDAALVGTTYFHRDVILEQARSLASTLGLRKRMPASGTSEEFFAALTRIQRRKPAGLRLGAAKPK
ncbi:TniQ family protein [Bradyrhizobium sp. BRP14]|nr:TniQ family protein [Bradyrhizobium sp. BRP14]